MKTAIAISPTMRNVLSVAKIPLETVIIGPGRKVTDIYYDWARGREVEEDGALLVRPDKFIGWRSATLPDDPEQALRTALSALLGQ